LTASPCGIWADGSQVSQRHLLSMWAHRSCRSLRPTTFFLPIVRVHSTTASEAGRLLLPASRHAIRTCHCRRLNLAGRPGYSAASRCPCGRWRRCSSHPRVPKLPMAGFGWRRQPMVLAGCRHPRLIRVDRHRRLRLPLSSSRKSCRARAEKSAAGFLFFQSDGGRTSRGLISQRPSPEASSARRRPNRIDHH
jgi:hypothetical protein